MQLSIRINRSIFFILICFSFFVIYPCTSNSIAISSMPQDINSSSIANITPVPMLSDHTVASGSGSPQNTGSAGSTANHRFAPINPDFITYQQKIATITDNSLQKSATVIRKHSIWSGIYSPDNRSVLYERTGFNQLSPLFFQIR